MAGAIEGAAQPGVRRVADSRPPHEPDADRRRGARRGRRGLRLADAQPRHDADGRAAMLSYLEGLRPQGKAAVAFGSYGWGRGGPEAIDEALRRLEWEIVREPLRAHWRPTPEVLAECREAGRRLAEAAMHKSEFGRRNSEVSES